MKKIILDLDTGIDDTLALAYVLASPEAELIGITGTYGNVTLEQGVRNDLDLLAMFGREDVPVFRGIEHACDAESFAVTEDSELFHGKNGLGNVEVPVKSDRAPEEKSAVDFIIESVHAYGDDLVVVPTGASTTIAAAMRKDPSIIEKIHIVTMGGSLTQPGNVSPFAEANMSQDPVASNEMFSSGADITMIGLDVTMQALMPMEDTQKLRDTGSAAGKFLADMTDYYIDISIKYDESFAGGCFLHDPLAAAVAIDPTLVTTFPIALKVETEGPERGRTIGDPFKLMTGPKNTKVALAVDSERFDKQFFDRLYALATSLK
ncbi:nucleoside hydrolase [Bifidobacterium pullorum subsp. saeculare]|nr:nucleoside hydrolase [Bifidobacterium pullorum]MBM6696282.1 nucleoside hydrolase [Bifidobacterium pullorum subsp. saeculare]